jgi:hypothetical protein
MGSELDPIWVPTAQDISRARVTAFAEFVARRYGYRGSTYLDLWQWSVASLDDFWDAVWTFFDVQSPTPYRRTRDGTMPHVRWFDGAEVSYVAHLFRDRPANAVAIIDLQEAAAPEQRRARYLTWAQLRAEVAAVAAELRRLGCGRAVGPQRGRRTRRHRPDAVDAHQILGDDDGSRYRSSYFDTYPGVWRHGDWVTLTDDYAMMVHGRSDATLNRNGVRMGSSDIYRALETVSDVTESLVVGVERPDGVYWMPLFVSLAEGAVLDDRLRSAIRSAIRDGASPRHLPDDIIEIDSVPHTLTGKKLEIPVKRILLGQQPADVVDLGAVDHPEVLEHIAAHAAMRSPA